MLKALILRVLCQSHSDTFDYKNKSIKILSFSSACYHSQAFFLFVSKVFASFKKLTKTLISISDRISFEINEAFDFFFQRLLKFFNHFSRKICFHSKIFNSSILFCQLFFYTKWKLSFFHYFLLCQTNQNVWKIA